MAHPHGQFSWTDISLPDPAAGRDFYSRLFGWEADDQHDEEGRYVYTMFSKGGRTVAGLGPQPPDSKGTDIPPMWTSYVSVDDLDATLERWAEGGGSVMVPGFDVLTAGRMAVVADPEGAVLALWQAGEHGGAEALAEHGALAWNELNTRDSSSARSFYGPLLGWEFERFQDGSSVEYWVIRLGGGALAGPASPYAGGILTMDESWPAEVPPHWMVYFQVDDTDAFQERLTGLGGNVSVPAFDTSAGRIAVVSDPQGGTFSVVAPGQASPA